MIGQKAVLGIPYDMWNDTANKLPTKEDGIVYTVDIRGIVDKLPWFVVADVHSYYQYWVRADFLSHLKIRKS